jgi:Flp pilus assembly protein TadD
VSAPTSSVADVYRRGFAAHQAGRLQEAEQAYREVLEGEPGHPDSLHLLGVLAHQVGRNDVAEDYIGQAIARMPRRPDFHNNLGLVLNHLGRAAEAEAALMTALRLNPKYPDALNNLGIALAARGRHVEAVACYRKALKLQANYPDACNNLGLAYKALGRFTEAEARFRAALAFKPDFAEAHGNLGIVLAAQGRTTDAEASYRAALRLRPSHREALNNLGVLLSDRGQWSEAEGLLREAVRLDPDAPDAYRNLGAVLTHLKRAAEAEPMLRLATRLAPEAPEGHFNLGAALHDLRRLSEADMAYREALRLAPDFADAHNNRAYGLLLAGRYAEGWREYEWRWRTRWMAGGARGFAAPQWTGEPLEGRTILLHAEQGLGDSLQFCRYAPLISGAGRVIIEVQPPLKRLMTSLSDAIEVVARGEPLPDFDLHCPLMSLPLALYETSHAIPATIPYLAADPDDAALWRARLSRLAAPRVGLVWAGNSHLGHPAFAAVDARRSVTLCAMAPLAGVSGVSFISLQKGAPSAQAADPPAGMVLNDFTARLEDFADTAALIDALDLVISVDTAVAHLAGAMGKPVWVLNRYDTCWRWLLNRSDSPWYPTLRLFRQPGPGDWDSVMRNVATALASIAGLTPARVSDTPGT